MFPGFGYKHIYPQAMPPQMKMGASNSPFTYETWPHHYGYPVPTQFHSCCNHNYPNYNPSLSLPYSHLPLHPQYYYYPIYPEPFQYAPPPHYTMELPKYEYDKTIPHCCGCHHVKPELNGEDKGVKIVGNGSGDENREGFLKNQDLPSDSIKLSGDGERDSRLSGWMPLDMDNLKRLLQNGKLRKDEDDQPMNQMPFPMIWLPCKNEEKMEKNGEKSSVEKSEKPLRTIHVKQLDENDDMKTGNGLKAKNSEEEKKDTRSKPSSPTKGSKLSPICLRIDPLPKKKKNGDGKSRSPSPPKAEVKPVEVVKPSSSIVEKDVVEVKNPSRVVGNDSESKEAKEKRPEKKMLSGAEAARIIQSAYRGYEVRRWEPLKKMRQIASIRDEALAMKRCIEASDESMDLKQKTALGETIMSLLLKLDTIQGLHSSMRDTRKSVAKELVSLQETLDAIVIKQQQPTEHFHGATKDKISGLQLQEASELESGEMIHEKQSMESEKDAASLGEEAGRQLSAGGLVSEQNESDALEDCTIKNVEAHDPTSECKPFGKESSHVGHVVSGSETDMNLYLRDELPAKLLESDQEASKDEAITMEPVKVESQVEVDNDEAVDKLIICSTENNKAKEDDESDQRRVMQEAHDPAPESEPIDPTSESKPIDKESSPMGHVDSASQNYVNLDLLDELPVGVMEDSDVRTGEEVSEDAVTWPEKIVESDKEASVIMEDEDVKGATPEESADYCNVEEAGESDQGRVMEDENGKMRDLLEKMIASGKEQQQVIFSLNQKLKELEAKLAEQKEKKKTTTKKGRRTRKLKLRF